MHSLYLNSFISLDSLNNMEFGDKMEKEINFKDIVKINKKTLYITIPIKLADSIDLNVKDAVDVQIKKLGGNNKK